MCAIIRNGNFGSFPMGATMLNETFGRFPMCATFLNKIIGVCRGATMVGKTFRGFLMCATIRNTFLFDPFPWVAPAAVGLLGPFPCVRTSQ